MKKNEDQLYMDKVASDKVFIK